MSLAIIGSSITSNSSQAPGRGGGGGGSNIHVFQQQPLLLRHCKFFPGSWKGGGGWQYKCIPTAAPPLRQFAAVSAMLYPHKLPNMRKMFDGFPHNLMCLSMREMSCIHMVRRVRRGCSNTPFCYCLLACQRGWWSPRIPLPLIWKISQKSFEVGKQERFLSLPPPPPA